MLNISEILKSTEDLIAKIQEVTEKITKLPKNAVEKRLPYEDDPLAKQVKLLQVSIADLISKVRTINSNLNKSEHLLNLCPERLEAELSVGLNPGNDEAAFKKLHVPTIQEINQLNQQILEMMKDYPGRVKCQLLFFLWNYTSEIWDQQLLKAYKSDAEISLIPEDSL